MPLSIGNVSPATFSFSNSAVLSEVLGDILLSIKGSLASASASASACFLAIIFLNSFPGSKPLRSFIFPLIDGRSLGRLFLNC